MSSSSDARAVLSLLREYRGLDARGAEVLSSLCNLLVRAHLLSITTADPRAARALLGPLALFGGAPAARLLARHCAEARKQQRNLQVVCDALGAARAELRDAADAALARAAAAAAAAEAAAAAAAGAGAGGARAGAAAGGAGAAGAAVSARRAAEDASAVSRGLRALLAADAARKVTALCTAGTAALLIGGGGGGRGGRRGGARAWLRRADAADAGSGGDDDESGDEDAAAAAPDAVDAASLDSAGAEAERLVEAVQRARDEWSEAEAGLAAEGDAAWPWAEAAWRASGGAMTLHAALAAPSQ